MKKYETGQGQLDRRKTEIRGIRQRKGGKSGLEYESKRKEHIKDS